MAILPISSSSLELSISMPGFSSSLSDGGVKHFDINQTPSSEEIGEEENPRKKLRLTKEQARLLEESFRRNQILNPKQKEELAYELKLRPRQVEVWFQNRRARTKLKQTEMECEYLKRCYGSLTEENKRLQREVEELRSLKVGLRNSCGGAIPVPTLTMCPRCERISSTNAGATLDNNGPTSTKSFSSLATHVFHHPRHHLLRVAAAKD